MNEQILSQQLGASALIVYGIEFLKRTPWTRWFTAHSDTLNRITSIVLAFCTSAGILWVASGNVISGGTLTITFPPLMQILNALLHGLGQVALQEGVYRVTVKPATDSTTGTK